MNFHENPQTLNLTYGFVKYQHYNLFAIYITELSLVIQFLIHSLLHIMLGIIFTDKEVIPTQSYLKVKIGIYQYQNNKAQRTHHPLISKLLI